MSQNDNSVETIFRYNGKEYEFDIRNAADAEKFELAFEKFSEAEAAAEKTGKSSVLIRGQCRMIRTFFDYIFGEGTGTAICGSEDAINIVYDAYDTFCGMVHVQSQNIAQIRSSFNKYSNRKQRRSAAKKK